MNFLQHGDGVYALYLFPERGNNWSRVGFVSVKNLDNAGAPDCDMGEWVLLKKEMSELGFSAELPLPKKASVRMDYISELPAQTIFAELVPEVYRTDSGQPLAAADFNMFRVVSFRKAL